MMIFVRKQNVVCRKEIGADEVVRAARVWQEAGLGRDDWDRETLAELAWAGMLWPREPKQRMQNRSIEVNCKNRQKRQRRGKK